MSIKNYFILVFLFCTSNFVFSNEQVKINKLVFNEEIAFYLPNNYYTVEEKLFEDGYIFEAMPTGQDLENWKDMVTFSSQKDITTSQNFSINQVSRLFIKAYKEQCPKVFSFISLPSSTIDGKKATSSLIRCSKVVNKDGVEFSETTLLTLIEGEQDLFTIQISHQNKPNQALSDKDLAFFLDKLKLMEPIMICDKNNLDKCNKE